MRFPYFAIIKPLPPTEFCPEKGVLFIVAEEQGFEPWHRVTSLRAFQARPFSLLGIPPLFAARDILSYIHS